MIKNRDKEELAAMISEMEALRSNRKDFERFYCLSHVRDRFVEKYGNTAGDMEQQAMKKIGLFFDAVYAFLKGRIQVPGWNFCERRVIHEGSANSISDIVWSGEETLEKMGETVTPFELMQMRIVTSQLMAFNILGTREEDIMRWMESEELWRRDYVSAVSWRANAAMIDAVFTNKGLTVKADNTASVELEDLLGRRAAMRICKDRYMEMAGKAVCRMRRTRRNLVENTLWNRVERRTVFEMMRMEFLPDADFETIRTEEDCDALGYAFSRVLVELWMSEKRKRWPVLGNVVSWLTERYMEFKVRKTRKENAIRKMSGMRMYGA